MLYKRLIIMSDSELLIKTTILFKPNKNILYKAL